MKIGYIQRTSFFAFSFFNSMFYSFYRGAKAVRDSRRKRKSAVSREAAAEIRVIFDFELVMFAKGSQQGHHITYAQLHLKACR